MTTIRKLITALTTQHPHMLDAQGYEKNEQLPDVMIEVEGVKWYVTDEESSEDRLRLLFVLTTSPHSVRYSLAMDR